MKVAVMMRSIDQPSAFQSFVEGIVEEMLTAEPIHQFILIYRTAKWYGRFQSYPNAIEVLSRSPHKIIWDQLMVPLVAWKHKADIIYNPKFSVPLVSHCPTTMGLAEMGWRIWPEYYEKLDVIYQKIMFPIYCKKSKHFFPWSNFQKNEISHYLGRKLDNATITPPGAHPNFKPISEEQTLEHLRMKYELPPNFILGVTRVDHPGLDGSTTFFPGKNVDTTVGAFIDAKNSIDYDLVIAGRRVKEYLLYRGFQESDFERIHFLGFVPHDELPGLFNLAILFIMPSYFEGFGLTLLEAMACGCPSIVAKTGSCPEVGDAAVLLADPNSPQDFAEKMRTLLNDRATLAEMKNKGLKRATEFSYQKSASDALAALDNIVKNKKRHPF